MSVSSWILEKLRKAQGVLRKGGTLDKDIYRVGGAFKNAGNTWLNNVKQIQPRRVVQEVRKIPQQVNTVVQQKVVRPIVNLNNRIDQGINQLPAWERAPLQVIKGLTSPLQTGQRLVGTGRVLNTIGGIKNRLDPINLIPSVAKRNQEMLNKSRTFVESKAKADLASKSAQFLGEQLPYLAIPMGESANLGSVALKEGVNALPKTTEGIIQGAQLLKASKIAKLAEVGVNMAKNALIGSAFTGGSAFAEGKGAKEVLKQGAIGLGVGAGLSLATEGIGAIIGKIANARSKLVKVVEKNPKAQVVLDAFDKHISDTVPEKVISGVDKVAPLSNEAKVVKPTIQKGIQEAPTINTKNFNISDSAKNRITKEINEIKPQIEAKVGVRLSNKEAIDLADNSSRTLKSAVGREQTKQWEAALLKTRQQLAASAKSNKIDKEFIENLKVVKGLATDTARKLQSFSIAADPLNATPKQAMLEGILKVNDNTDEILKAAKGVDFNNADQATNFYRTFVKPKTSDWVDLIRYNSMLSSPLTHIKNITTNALQVGLVKPVEKTISGVIDVFSKKPTNFVGEGAAYTSGVIKNIGAAIQKFSDVMSGKAGLTNLDLKYIPPSTSKGTKFLSFPTRMLDGMDQFFTTLGAGGEKAALKLKQAKGIKIGNIDELAKEKAAYTVFREKLGNTQQGYILDGIDKLTGMVEKARQSENPVVSTIAKFTLPFVRTPMNIFKQGLEYSPAGFATTLGAKNVSEQISKALIGSAVFGGAASLIGSGRLTWSEPINEKQRNEFRAAGMQPYSVKIGDKWISYKYLGPLAFPLAMTSAIDYEVKNGRMDDTTSERIMGAVARYGSFLTDQSYAKSMGDLLQAVGGSESGIARVASNYPQQLIPLRALGGWLARITDPNQRKISKDANFIEKQTQLLMQNIPGLSQKLETRPDTFGNPIPNQNRVFNALSPLSVTKENPLGKDVYNTSEAKRAENREIQALKDKNGGQTSTGKFVRKIGDEYQTFDNENEMKVGVAKDEFRKSNKVEQIYGDVVFKKSKSGSITTEPKLDYDIGISDSILTQYYKKKDFKSYMTEADKLMKMYETKYKTDLPAEDRITLENKMIQLAGWMQKYGSYGGFKKGRSAKKGKKGKKVKTVKKSFTIPKTKTVSLSVAKPAQVNYVAPKTGSAKKTPIKKLRVKQMS